MIYLLIYLLIGVIIWDIKTRRGALDDYDASTEDFKEAMREKYDEDAAKVIRYTQKIGVVITSALNIILWPIILINGYIVNND